MLDWIICQVNDYLAILNFIAVIRLLVLLSKVRSIASLMFWSLILQGYRRCSFFILSEIILVSLFMRIIRWLGYNVTGYSLYPSITIVLGLETTTIIIVRNITKYLLD